MILWQQEWGLQEALVLSGWQGRSMVLCCCLDFVDGWWLLWVGIVCDDAAEEELDVFLKAGNQVLKSGDRLGNRSICLLEPGDVRA